MKTLFLLLPFFCLTLLHPAQAQSDRSPTPQEKVAIDKAVHAVVSVMQQFVNNNWEVSSGGPDAPEDYSVQKEPDVAMGVEPFNVWDITVAQNSNLWNTLIAPYLAKLDNPPANMNDKKAMDAYEALNKEYGNIKDVYVEVNVNEKNLPINPIKGDTVDLKIPGCYFAYKQSNDPNKLLGTDRELKNSYVLAFGNWKNAKVTYYSDIPYYAFRFLHPPATPYIENIVFIISGNNNRIQQLLKTINWNKIDEGLTR